MAKQVPRWLKVCGIGCGALALVAAGLIAGGVYFVRDALRNFESADQAFDTVVERYGAIPEFHPEPDGSVRPERMEAFLAVRETIAPEREELETSLRVLSGNEDSAGRLRRMRAILGLVHQAGNLHNRRNEALLQAEMGFGEYYYLYTLVYYAWLGKSPDDGPSFKLVGERGYVLEKIEDLDESEVRQYRMEQARRSLNRLLLPALRNQLSELTGEEVGGDLSAWTEALSAEVTAMETDPRRLPWQEGLPGGLASSLQVYRDRLEESYGPMCNALEIGLARR